MLIIAYALAGMFACLICCCFGCCIKTCCCKKKEVADLYQTEELTASGYTKKKNNLDGSENNLQAGETVELRSMGSDDNDIYN